jgi:hypothetical protein
MKRIFVLVTLAAVAGSTAAADPWKLPDADGQKLVARVTRVISRDEWSVERQENDITVRRIKPVAMARVQINAPVQFEPRPPILCGEQTIKYVLRFAPKMSMNEYERLAVVNATSEKERHRLFDALKLTNKGFNDVIATTPDEMKRLAEFRATVAKLPRHTLPDYYTTDYSIFFLQSGDDWSYPVDKNISAECENVRDTLERYFGMYDPAAAARGRGHGQYLPEQRK